MALAAMILVICAGLIVVLRGHGLETAASWAQLASVPLAVVPLIPLVTDGWRNTGGGSTADVPERVDRAQEALARLVLEQWRAEIRMRRLDDPAPMAVRWRLTGRALMDHTAHVAPSRGLWFLLGGDRPRFAGRSDRVAALVRAYQQLPRRRLVILGEPGMGKTTLAVLLLRRLLHERRARERVPVMVTLSGWDPDSLPFDDWLAARLAETYPALSADAFGRDAPRALVRERRILPVLDGLDELPEHTRPRVIIALNEALAADDALILTCRTREYAAAVNAPGGDVLTAGAVIEPSPLHPSEAAAYLARSLPPHPPGTWPALLTGLTAGARTPLTDALATPLALWLLRKVYVDTRTDPAALSDPSRFSTPDEIIDHLLDHLIDALVTTGHDKPIRGYPWPARPAHDTARVRDCLSYLARHLRRTNTTNIAWWHLHKAMARGTVDNIKALAVGLFAGLTLTLTNVIVFGFTGKLGNGLAYGLAFAAMYRLFCWAAARRPHAAAEGRRPRQRMRQILRRAAVWLAGGLAFGLTSGLADALTDGLADGLADGLTVGLSDGLAIGFAYGLATGFFGPDGPDAEPAYANFRLPGRTRALLHHVATWLTCGLLFGPAVGLLHVLAAGLGNELAYGPAGGPIYGVAAASALGVTFGLTFGLGLGIRNWSRTPQATDKPLTPRDSLRRDLRLTCLEALSLGLATALAFGLELTLVAGATNGLSYGLLFGLTFALMIGLRGCSGTYLVTLVCVRRHAPLRLMRFLDDAYRLGLLRQSGTVYQFRHAKLQDRLAATPTPPTDPRATPRSMTRIG
jgi:hypothetical protein